MGFSTLAKQVFSDKFVFYIFGTALFAIIFPAPKSVQSSLSLAVALAIAGLFFLFGVRLSPAEAVAGLKHWRLHLMILSFTFIFFPLLGFSLSLVPSSLLPPTLYMGVLYLTLVSSTVQSSIAFTSISGGNVPGAIVSATLSNFLGIFITPALIVLSISLGFMHTSGAVTIEPRVIFDIVLQLLLPFLCGQFSRPWIKTWVTAHKSYLTFFDKGSILLVVYSAFSEGMHEGIWKKVSAQNLLILIIICIAIVAFFLIFSWFSSGILGFSTPDRKTIQFCGSKKSLATGLPMAFVFFSRQPMGEIVIPLMFFHQIQLIMCSGLAGYYSGQLTTITDDAHSPS